MDALVIDLTHGGYKIAIELSRLSHNKYNKIWVWDIYHTLNQEQENFLESEGIIFTDKLPEVEEIEIIAPVHCPLEIKIDLTHHEAVKLILEPWKTDKIPIVEVTGVKGKSSVVGMLKEILSSHYPLILSSLGVECYQNHAFTNLKKDISITPASIIESIQLAEKCNYGICIFETSLGGTGLADVGILTNVVENYTIGQGKSKASNAKRQIFNSEIVCCEKEALDKYYTPLKKEFHTKINTFSLKDPKANLRVLNVKYGLKKTYLEILVSNLKTIKGRTIDTRFNLTVFAPTPYQVSNLLAAISAALTLNCEVDIISNKISQFKGVEGRTSIKNKKGCNIIEEVNPGINVKAIEKILKMAKNLENCFVILGGQYGITCEEIDELKTVPLLEEFQNSINLILTHQLGKGVLKKMKTKPIFMQDPQDALNLAIQSGAKNIVFIYRSNYANLNLR